MLSLRQRCPVDYRLCTQTVTVYHKDGDTYTRTVYDRAFLDFKKTQNVDKTGSSESNSFFARHPVRPSDGARWGQGFARDWRGDHHAGSLDGFCPGQSARSVRGQVCRPQILAREYGTHRDGRLICRLTSESTQKASIILYGGSARSSSRSGRRSQ